MLLNIKDKFYSISYQVLKKYKYHSLFTNQRTPVHEKTSTQIVIKKEILSLLG
ncbi:hypothetical protein HanIR_Chr11g0508441 [Helianthus annuus]|nr:hypothetical protein HanIR_Chr11g0508441 [Helianthus annuus]